MEGFLMSKTEKLSGFDFARLANVRALKPGLLHSYQSDGVAFLLSKKRVVLGDDMGLGKTRQAIISMQMGAPEGKILVVCPDSFRTDTYISPRKSFSYSNFR
jgi:SNF2 family DNA or RNA helicase